MLISTSVPNLIGGVTQQPEDTRFPTQCDEQINATSSILTGLNKRAGTTHVATLSSFVTDAVTIPIERSDTEKYLLRLGNQSVSVLRPDGTEVPVRTNGGAAVVPANLTYLTTDDPKADLYAVTSADHTIVLNRSVTVEMEDTLSDTILNEALVLIKLIKEDATYTLKIYDDPSSNTASAAITAGPMLSTALQWHVLAAFYESLTQDYSRYDVLHSSGVMWIRKKDKTPLRVEIECSIPEGAFAFQNRVQQWSTLPKEGWGNFRIEVTGDPTDEGDDYVLQYIPNTTGAKEWCEGTWCESLLGGTKDKFKKTTMPHVLKDYGDHFVWDTLDWADRKVGDDTTNPEPSFVGQQIRDVFWFRNRLGFLAGENKILSEAGEYWNFWRTTVINLRDSDPIDVGASHSRISWLNYATPIAEKLVVFSERTQFVLSTDNQNLTPKTGSLELATELKTSTSVHPLTHLQSIFVPFPLDDYTGLYEYHLDVNTEKFTADNVSEHCPRYIKGKPTHMVMSPNDGMLMIKTGASSNLLYVYRYFTRGSEKVQSSWSKWDFTDPILDIAVLDNDLYLFVQRANGYTLEKLSLIVDLNTGTLDFPVLVDRMIKETSTSRIYKPALDITNITLPFVLRSPTVVNADTGATIAVLKTQDNVLRVSGDHTATKLYIGESYTMSYTMSRPRLQSQGQQGGSAVVPGRFQVRYGIIDFSESRLFSVSVTPKGRAESVSQYTSRVLGTSSSVANSVLPAESGKLRFPVFSKNDQVTITVTNSSPYPSRFLSVDWEMLYTAKAQRQ